MHYRTAAVIVAVAIAGTAIGAFAWTSSRELLQTAISIDRAREIALAQARGGAIAEEELEREGDASIYSFDIRLADGRLVEVEIDAMTGAVLGDDEERGEDDGEDPDDEPDSEDQRGRRPQRD